VVEKILVLDTCSPGAVRPRTVLPRGLTAEARRLQYPGRPRPGESRAIARRLQEALTAEARRLQEALTAEARRLQEVIYLHLLPQITRSKTSFERSESRGYRRSRSDEHLLPWSRPASDGSLVMFHLIIRRRPRLNEVNHGVEDLV